MFSRSFLKDIVLFLGVLLLLLIVIPIITSIFKHLIILQLIILIIGTIALTYIVQKVRGKTKR